MKTIPTELTIDPEFAALIPPLAPEEREQLERNILADGCRDPLTVWDGVIVDGHNRYEICTRHGLLFKTVGIEFFDREAAMDWMDANQLGRRNLSPDQFRLLLGRRYNRAKKTKAEAGAIGGTSNAQSEQCSNEDTADLLADQHGVSRATVVRAGEFAEAVEEVKESQPEVVAEGEAAILREAKKIKRQRKEKRMAERKKKAAKAAQEAHKTSDESFTLLTGDLLEASAHIPDASVDIIVTDPPYPEQYLETFSKLSELAERVLKPGGHCLVMSGQSHLPEVYLRLCERLKYQWTLNYYTPGQSTQVFGRKVKSNWKPVIWMIKGKNEWEHVQDTITSDENDKRFHHWGQSVSGTARLIELFSVQHQTVLDPFVGGGTTAVAAIATGRKFIGIDLDAECIAVTAKRLKEMEVQDAA
jgi:site-specific DNA-methyltransferase (adenine-specific)